MYFQNDNAIKIDIIRMTVEKRKSANLINEGEYFYLLAALVVVIRLCSPVKRCFLSYVFFSYEPLKKRCKRF